MLVICVRRKYVTLIYDTTQAGGVYPGWWGDGLPEEEVYKFCLK